MIMLIFNSKLLVITRGYPLLYGHVYRESLQVPGHRRLEALRPCGFPMASHGAIRVSIDTKNNPKTASNNDMSIIYSKI
jgi:hypothetical protein